MKKLFLKETITASQEIIISFNIYLHIAEGIIKNIIKTELFH